MEELRFQFNAYLVPPVFNDSLAEVKIEALINTTVKLLCSAYGFPKPSISWSFRTTSLKPLREEELIIEHVQVSRSSRLKPNEYSLSIRFRVTIQVYMNV